MFKLKNIPRAAVSVHQLLWSTFRAYGELVLKPVSLAERAAGAEIAFSSAKKQKLTGAA